MRLRWPRRRLPRISAPASSKRHQFCPRRLPTRSRSIINIDYSGTGGGAAAGPDNGLYENYSTVRADLINNAAPGDTTFNALPTGSTIQGQSQVAVWNAQLKLFGLLPANSTTTDDGSATFATDINPNLLVGVALHELTHAMGRVPYGSQPDIFDFYRFTSPGTYLFSDSIPSSAAYFSVDGGNTKLADFGLYSDPSDFLNAANGALPGPYSNLTPNDAFDELYGSNTTQGLSAIDKQMLDALGFDVAVPPAPPTVSVSSVTNATGGQHIALSSLVTISNPGNVGYQLLELWDSNGTVAGGRFVVNGVAQTGGHEIDVTPGSVASTVFDAGTAGGSDMLWARLLENDGTLTAWQPFTVSVPTPTLTVSNDASATGGQHIALSSLVAISDPGIVGYQQLELWDSNGTVAGGQFVVNGVTQTGGHEIDVAPGSVASTVFDAGTSGGTDTLWARLLQDDGTLTAWQPFTVSVPTPTLTVSNDASATGGQHIALSSLVTISNPGNVGYQLLELWDSNGTMAGGQFVVNGVTQTGGHEIDVAPGSVASTVFDAGTAGGSDMLWARLLENDGTLTAWQPFTVSVPTPTLTVSNDASATGGQHITLSSLVAISDPGIVGYQQLELWDSNGTVAGGQFVVNGVAQTGGHEIDVAPGSVASTVFDAGTAGGSDMLWARLLENDGTLTAWQPFTVSVPTPTLTVSNDASATGGQHIALSSLVAISDPGIVGYQQLELWDSNGTVAGGQFVVNGVTQTGGHEIDVAPGSVASTVFDAGTSGGTDTLWARLLQDDGTLTAWQQFSVTNAVPALTAAQVAAPQSIWASTGGPSNDTFVFRPGLGASVIDNALSLTTIELDGFSSVTNDAQLATLLSDAQSGRSQALFQSENGGHDTIINLGNHDSITLTNVHISDLHSTNFIIH